MEPKIEAQVSAHITSHITSLKALARAHSCQRALKVITLVVSVSVLLFNLPLLTSPPPSSERSRWASQALAKPKRTKAKRSKSSKSSKSSKKSKRRRSSRGSRRALFKKSKRSKRTSRGRKHTTKQSSRRRSKRHKTGVKSLWRRDGQTERAGARWQKTKRAIKRRARARRRSSLRWGGRRSSRWRERERSASTPPQSSIKITSYELDRELNTDTIDTTDTTENAARLTSPYPDHPTDYAPREPERARGGWLEGLELQGATTLWSFDAPLRRSSDDDWSEAGAEPVYRVKPSLLYRAELRLFTRLLDASVSYETRQGVSLFGDQGSLFGLASSLPSFLPALSPLSLHYQRVRFEQGAVALREAGGADLERQRFRVALDDYELRWQLSHTERISAAFVLAWRERALPRHVYLEERVGEGEAAYSVFYEVSDQLLWTPTQTFDVGGQWSVALHDRLLISMGLALGGGSYELQAPLSGVRLDEGSLFTFALSAEASYEQPLSSWLTLKLSYQAQALFLEPLGLPTELTRSLSREGVATSDLSLSFGTVDVLQRAWVSFVLSF